MVKTCLGNEQLDTFIIDINKLFHETEKLKTERDSMRSQPH